MRENTGPEQRGQVKVCGIREPSEAAALDAMGVEWLGFNFHPGSSRHVTAQAAQPMIRALRHAIPVGVFVDADPDFVIEVTKLTGIRYVQLHGNEDWDFVRRMPVPVIKAIPHTRLADLGGLRAPLEAALRRGESLSPLAYFLVDTHAAAPGAVSGAAASGTTGAFGGSGKIFDWALLAAHPLPLPFFLAGGLGPQNLAEALRASPFAVDLNSKVEVSPGRKDLEKVKASLGIVRA